MNSSKLHIELLEKGYRLGDAVISDSAFKHLENNLIRITPKYNYFNSLDNPLPKLPKDNYKLFLNSLLKRTRLSIEPKISGTSIAIEYINGKINKAITKDNIDITKKINQLINIPKVIPIIKKLQVRGKLYEPNQKPLHSKISTNTFLNKKNIFHPKLDFSCFQILNGRLNQYETLNYLKKCGFNTPNCYFTNFTSQVEFFRQEWLSGKLFTNYPTNGIVIKINSRKLQLLREKSDCSFKDWQYAIEN
tara:strand:- start:6019 stop:6762 length:744 start_codon:yes stop_codon:yes gene_type:complete